MKRKHRQYSHPRKMFDKARIIEENKLKEKYGLKNKREIWKADAKVKYFRSRAKGLLEATHEEQQKFFDNLNALGLGVETVTDVLALNMEAILKRRLATVLVARKLAHTPRHARQMIVHKKVLVDGRVVNVPSYLVPVDEEKKITLKKKAPKPKADPAQDTSTTESTEAEPKAEEPAAEAPIEGEAPEAEESSDENPAQDTPEKTKEATE